MKSLLDKIYEGFYGNVGAALTYNFSLVTAEYTQKLLTGRISKGQIRVTISGRDWFIDTLCDCIIKLNPKITSEGPKINTNEYSNISKTFKGIDKFKSEKDTWDDPNYEYYRIPMFSRDVVGTIMKKIYNTDACDTVALAYGDGNIFYYHDYAYAFALAALKLKNLIDEDIKFADMMQNAAKYNDILQLLDMMSRFIASGITKTTVRPPLDNATVRAALDAEQIKYDDALVKIDQLKADIQLLKDNGYQFNSMIEKTISDINDRSYVIARLANKYKK